MHGTGGRDGESVLHFGLDDGEGCFMYRREEFVSHRAVGHRAMGIG